MAEDGHLSAKKPASRTPWPNYVSAALGLRNYWYVALISQELGEGRVKGEQICGERIMFKRIDGKVYAIEDRCPHRGVQLSARATCHSKNTVSCWVHGFTFDVRDGKLVQIITDPSSNLIGKLEIKSYPVEERANLIFVWIGDAKPLPIEDELPRSFMPYLRGELDRAPKPAGRLKMGGNWRMALENSVDFTHFYGHRTQEVMRTGQAAQPLSNLPPADPEIIMIDQPGRPQSFTTATDKFELLWEVSIEDSFVRAATTREAWQEMRKFRAEAMAKQVQTSAEVGATTYLPGALEVGGPPGPRPTLCEFYTPVDEDHYLLVVVDTNGLGYSDLMISNDPEKWADIDNEGFLNFDAYYRAKAHHAYKNEDWFRRGRVYRGDSTIVALRHFVEKHARGFQSADNGWASVEKLQEMEVLYAPES